MQPSFLLAVMFNTDRLVLRPFRETDIDNIVGLWNDPLVQRGVAVDHMAPRGPKFADQVRNTRRFVSPD